MALGKQQLAHWIYVLEGLMMSIFSVAASYHAMHLRVERWVIRWFRCV